MPKQSEEQARLSRRQFVAGAAGVASVLGLAGLAPGTAAGLELPDFSLDFAADWGAVRAQFVLPPELVYMNNGSLGPCPGHVLNESVRAWQQLETDPVGEGFGPLLKQAEEVRAKAAAFLGCATEEMALTRNTTEGMNTVAQGLRLRPGQRVLTTDHEHPGGFLCWEYYAKRDGVAIDQVKLPAQPQDADQIAALFKAKLRPETRVVSLSHVTFSTGLRLPVKQIAALAAANGSLTVVDGAQAPGALNVNVKELGCDAYAASAHKWMLAPKGSGLLYIRREARDRIDPLLLHRGNRAYTAATGTRNIPAIIGLGAAIDFLNRIGKDKVEARVFELRRRLIEGLGAVPGATLASPAVDGMAAALTTLALPAGTPAGKVARALHEKHRIVVKVVPRRFVNGLRISTHVYNTEAEIARLLAALKDELK